MSKKPLIGITLDSQEPGRYSRYPWYALRANYCSAIVNAGATPLPLPHELGSVDHYLDLIDGLMITGGGHDVDPTLYGASEIHPTTKINVRRTAFEMEITTKALERNIPVFGICGGMQLLNVALGGTLIQHIPDEVENCLVHSQETDRHSPCHNVRVLENTLFHEIVRQAEIPVNSVHHQAVKALGKNLNANTIAPDGLIEGIESPDYRFCMGLQWHPEFIVSEHDASVFKAFIESTRAA